MAQANDQSNGREVDKPIDEKEIWEALVEEPGIGVSILAGNGEIIYANPQAARLFLDRRPDEVVGKKLYDLFPHEWVKERVELMSQIQSSDPPVVLRSIWRGRQTQSTIRRIVGPDAASTHYLVVTRQGTFDERPSPEEFKVVDSKIVELGPLDVLSTRELEVLSLLGQGLRIKEIAALVHRTPKTIDNHRTSIGRKLREVDRVQLARLAGDAGLELKDASLKRVHLKLD